MKINKKIIVSSMALCMGAALAGSVSGTIAWYQYSTRSTVAMLGTSVGVNRNLQVKVGSDGVWATDLKVAAIDEYLNKDTGAEKNTHSKGDLKPVTPVAKSEVTGLTADEQAKNFKSNPIYQFAATSSWADAEATDWVEIPLYFRSISYSQVDAEGKMVEDSITYNAVNVYLNDVTIQNKAVSGKNDITDAVRVSVEGKDANKEAVYANISKNGGSINTFGPLDMNGDGEDDTAQKYEFEEGTFNAIKYGTENSKETTYKMGGAAQESELYGSDETQDTITGKVFGVTPASKDAEACKITLKIWLQGWAELKIGSSSNKSAMWNVKDYVGSQFYVGTTFTCASK